MGSTYSDISDIDNGVSDDNSEPENAMNNNDQEKEFERWLIHEVKLKQYLGYFKYFQQNEDASIYNIAKITKKKLQYIIQNDNKKKKQKHIGQIMEHVNRHKQLHQKSILLEELLEQNIIVEEQKHDIDFDITLFYCWFTLDMIQNGMNEYQIYLYFFDNNNIYTHTFKTTYQMIQKLYQSAYNCRQKYFVTQPFPALINIQDKYARNEELQQNMQLMQRYMILDRQLPDMNDMNGISKILCQLFNCPLFIKKFCSNTTISIGMNENIQIILQILADEWLYKLRVKSKAIIKRDHTLLYTEQKWGNIEFNRVYLVQSANGTFTSHWALMFEGDQYLLTLDYFQNNKCYCKLLQNDIHGLGQRIFWYSGIYDNIEFNKKWIELLRVDLYNKKKNEFDPITCSDIGYLITKWMENYEQYDIYENNCQHFARDIFSVFNKNMAIHINKKSGKTFAAGSGAPMLQFIDMEQEKIRIYTISETLKTVLDNEKQKREKQKEMNEQKVENSDVEGIPNCNDENIQLKEWLENVVKLPQYFGIFIRNGFESLQMIKDTKDILDEQCLKEIGINKLGHVRKISLESQKFWTQ